MQGAVWSCVLNSTAMLAATASADFSAKLWDAISGNELHTLQHSHIVRACQFAEQSPKLITGGVHLSHLLHIYYVQQQLHQAFSPFLAMVTHSTTVCPCQSGKFSTSGLRPSGNPCLIGLSLHNPADRGDRPLAILCWLS